MSRARESLRNNGEREQIIKEKMLAALSLRHPLERLKEVIARGKKPSPVLLEKLEKHSPDLIHASILSGIREWPKRMGPKEKK